MCPRVVIRRRRYWWANTVRPTYPIRFRDPSNPPHRFWAISDESDRFWGHFAHTTRSVMGLGLLLSLGFMSGVILPIRFRPTRRSDSPPTPPRIHPKCCSDPEIHLGWPNANHQYSCTGTFHSHVGLKTAWSGL